MRAALLLAVLALTNPPKSWSQTPETSPKARALLDQTISALGGEAFLKVKTEKIEGRVYAFRRDRLSGFAQVIEYVRYPDKRREEYGKKKETIQILNGDQGWTIDIHGSKPIPPEEMKEDRQQEEMSAFYILRYRLGEPGSTVEYSGRDLVGNQEVDLVNFVDPENRTATFSLDRQTHLPYRVTWAHRDPQTRERIEEIEQFSNYFAIQGITAPRHLLRQRNGTRVFEAFIQEVRYNLDLSDSLFTPPAR